MNRLIVFKQHSGKLEKNGKLKIELKRYNHVKI